MAPSATLLEVPMDLANPGLNHKDLDIVEVPTALIITIEQFQQLLLQV